ncbi:MAG: septum formation protein Maf [Crocinitomicaceae bacterium]|nr:septum formation protein Maf [Crocinitomicaceae bacterium]|tara:strand:- start:124 stop:693 length:570 start_codon:yes stop_codon:yes gene_type:complete
MITSYNIILGSKSPRRKQLLATLGIAFEIRTQDVEESFPETMPVREIAEYLALKKAESFEGNLAPNELVLTSDTTVVLGNRVMNKPQDRAEAIEMLSSLSGKQHEVITGVSLKSTSKTVHFSTTTQVFFKTLSQQEIEHYVDHYQPFDKAGAYGIQEWIGHIGIEKIEGCFFNVVGLPTQKVYEALTKF